MSYSKRLGLHAAYPSMDIKTLTTKEELDRLKREAEKVEYFINKTELNTIKTLFQLRNANYYKKYVKPVQLSDYATDIFPKERVFIAGKIFPFINLIFGWSCK